MTELTCRVFAIQLSNRVLAVAEQRLEAARRRFLELCA